MITEDQPWYRRRWILAGIGLILAAVIAAVFVTTGRPGDKDSSQPTSSPSSSASTSAVAPPPVKADGSRKTIDDYLAENQIADAQVQRGDAGAPNIAIPLPPEWSDRGADTPDWAYGAIVFDKAVDPNDPPSIVVLLSKLTGNVDAAKILEYAPGELENLPDYVPLTDIVPSTLSGFNAVQLAGQYTRDGQKRSIAQKTVVIPAPDGVYLLQMNADARDGESPVLMEATEGIDKGMTIKP